MKTNREQGNALIYVLIAIALFAALSLTLGRQTDTGEASSISDDKAALYATQLISYAAQAKSSVDQMIFSGLNIDDMDFVLPGTAGFDAGTTADKIKRVYHTDGGGLSPGQLPDEVAAYKGSDPIAGWYMGRFNNVEWSKTTGTDVVLIAYGIHKKVCEDINRQATGSATIPVLARSMRDLMIDDEFHSGTNSDFKTDPVGTPDCIPCHKKTSICVEDSTGSRYGFYTVLQDR